MSEWVVTMQGQRWSHLQNEEDEIMKKKKKEIIAKDFSALKFGSICEWALL